MRLAHTTCLAFAALVCGSLSAARPPESERTFRSSAVDAAIGRVAAQIADPAVREMFVSCYPNTLDTAVKGDGYIITGDIDAMWLRDSAAQVWPYLRHLKDDPRLAGLVLNLIRRQFAAIRRDPNANAFYMDPAKEGEWKDDATDMKPGVHERKFEVDSLCYPVRLAHGYWKATGDASPFDADGVATLRTIVETFRKQQRKDGQCTDYRFRRVAFNAMDTLVNYGWGPPVRPVGLIASAFRPSDDATTLPFHVPSNFFAAHILRLAAEALRTTGADASLAAECEMLADEVSAALREHAVFETKRWGPVYAYEVDGFGGRVMMDDANAPSLLSLPYLCGVDRNDPVYRNTRRMVLSPEGNPYYFKGKAVEGIGSLHSGLDKVWPMSLVMQILTSDDEAEMAKALRMVVTTTAGTGLMHESVGIDDPSDYTRPWFSWANTLFGEAIYELVEDGRTALMQTESVQ